MERSPRPLTLRERALALAIFAVTPFLAFPPRIWRSCFMDGGDDALHNLPLLTHAARATLAADLFWSPTAWMGTPVLDEPEFAIFYPPKILFALLSSPVLAYALYVYLHHVVAQAAAATYARAIGLSHGAAIVTGIVYGFTGFMIGHQGHTMYVVGGAWAPLFLAATHRYALDARAALLVGAVVAFAMLPLAGAFQLTVYLGGAALLSSAALAWQRRDAALLMRAAACVVLGLAAGALQILPSLLHSVSLEHGGRTDFAFATEHSLSPASLAALVMRPTAITAEGYVFVGASAFVASVAGILARRSEGAPDALDHQQRAWALVAAVAGALMLGHHLPLVTRVLHALPVLGVFRAPIRHGFELGIAVSVLTGIAIERGLARREAPGLAGRALGALLGVFALHRLAAAVGEVPSEDLVRPGAAVAAAFATALAILALARRWWLLLGATFLAEIAFVQAHAGWGRPDPIAGLEEARAHVALARSRAVAPRFFTPGLDGGRLGTLGANAALLFDGVGHLHGYASMAPRDAALVLELDEFGVASRPEELVYSQLPEIFGVTDVMSPPAVLGTPAFSLAAEGSCPRSAAGEPVDAIELAPGRPVSCRAALVAGRRVIVVEGEAGDRLKSVERAVWRGPWTVDRFVPLEGRTIIGDLDRTRVARFDVVPPRPAGDEAVLVETEIVPIAIGPRGVDLASAEGPPEVVVTPLAWPRDARGPFFLESGVSGSFEGQVVVDLQTDGYDPDDAQVVMLAPGTAASSFVAAPPPEARWRSFLEGRGTARVEHAAILAPAQETRRIALRDGGTIYVAAIRPLEIVVRLVNGDRSREARVSVAVAESEGSARAEVLAPGAERALRWMAPVPATAAHLTIEAQSEGAPVTASIVVREAPRAARRVAARLEGEPGSSDLAHAFVPDRLPRAYAATRARVEPELTAVRAALADDSFEPGRDVVVERPLAASDLHAAEVDAAFEPERVRLVVDAAAGPALVVVNDRFDPRWQATIDGAPTAILRVNGLVRGVEIPAGRHLVEMRFPAPRSFTAGVVVCLVALALAALSGLWEPRLRAALERRTGRPRS